jgi:hypothetical protein
MSWRLPLGLMAGRGSAFTPASVSNLALWFDATRITGLSDGGSVATWSDLSGNGRDATQATGASKPTYKTAILNGRPVVRFDGNDFLSIGAFDIASAAVTVFAVCSASAGSAQAIFEDGDADGGTTGFALQRNASNKAVVYGKGDAGYSSFVSTATLTTTAQTVSAVFDKSAVNEATLWLNGATAGVQSNSANTNTFTGSQAARLGMLNSVTQLLTGDIAELLLYRAALATTDRQAVETYLRAKWGTG